MLHFSEEKANSTAPCLSTASLEGYAKGGGISRQNADASKSRVALMKTETRSWEVPCDSRT